jgi:hypothetical protein
LVTARHLAPALLTAHRLCSTRSPCSSRLHVRAMPLSRVAATQKPCSPPLPRQPPSSRPSLLSSLFASATTAHIADRTNHCCCRRPRAPKPCHHIVLLSAREAVGLRPSSGQATNSPSSAWVPPSSPTGEPTARPQYQPTADVLPCSDYRRRGKRYSGEPPLPASYSHWPTHLVTAGDWDVAGAATSLGGARLPYSAVGPPTQLVWVWPLEVQCEQYPV